jgi:hypothetical protein
MQEVRTFEFDANEWKRACANAVIAKLQRDGAPALIPDARSFLPVGATESEIAVQAIRDAGVWGEAKVRTISDFNDRDIITVVAVVTAEEPPTFTIDTLWTYRPANFPCSVTFT